MLMEKPGLCDSSTSSGMQGTPCRVGRYFETRKQEEGKSMYWQGSSRSNEEKLRLIGLDDRVDSLWPSWLSG